MKQHRKFGFPLAARTCRIYICLITTDRGIGGVMARGIGKVMARRDARMIFTSNINDTCRKLSAVNIQ